MSRLNNDVVGAQNAISRTLVDMFTNIIRVIATLAVMFSLEWRMTLISIVIFPLFIIAVRQVSTKLRDIVRRQLVANAQMNAMMNETLNIGGALLVKLFGRRQLEVDRFGGRAVQVRQAGIDRTVTGSLFIGLVGLIAAIGTALVYGFGGYFVIKGGVTVWLS